MAMDIRTLFKRAAAEKTAKSTKVLLTSHYSLVPSPSRPAPETKSGAPVIIDDDDDFKPKGKGGKRGGAKETKKGSQEGAKRKRTRARIRDESDSEEDAPPKKIKGSPPQLASGGRGGGGGGGAGKAKGKQEVKPKISPGKKEIKSLSDFFGSAPIKRSSELKGKAIVPGHSKPSDGDGRSVLERRGEGAEREEVLTVPESPTEIASYGFDDESVAAVLEEEERETQKEKEEHDDLTFSKTLEELDEREVQPLLSASTPPTKKLKLMMEKVPIGKSPSKPHPLDTNKDNGDDFTDSIVIPKRTSTRKSPRKPSGKPILSKGGAEKKPSLSKENLEKKSSTKGSRNRKQIMYLGSSSEEEAEKNTKTDVKSSAKKESSLPVINKSVSVNIRKVSYTSPRKDEGPGKSELPKPATPVGLVKPVTASTSSKKATTQSSTGSFSTTPKRDIPKKPATSAAPAEQTSSTSSTTPKPSLSRAQSYLAYRNRGGPKAPGSKPIPEGAENCLEGLTFVITGVLESLEREEATDLVKRYGGKVTSNVSKKTSYIVVGEEAGESKLAKANSCGTKQIDEDKLLDLIRTLPEKGVKGTPAGRDTPARKPAKKASVKQPSPKRPSPPLESTEQPITGKEPSTPKFQSGSATPKATPPQSHRTTSVSVATPPPVSIATPPQSHVSTPVRTPVAGAESLMWVDKYRPKSTKNIIGQQGDRSNAKKLARWLQSWYKNHGSGGSGSQGSMKPSSSGWGKGGGKEDGAGFKAALLSGPPGVGKTTTATLVCEEAGFTFVEMNASVTRNQKTLHEEVASHLSCLSIDAFLEGRGGGAGGGAGGKCHALIMDEVDGMAGTEDRGGVQELIQLIKSTRVPVICICNDRRHPKIRSLANYCFDLRFQRPRVDQIKGAMMSVCFKEGVKMPPQAITEIIMASGQDVRQVLHNMSVWTATDKSLSFDQAKDTARSAKKETKLNPFEVVRLVFMPREGERDLSLNERSELFFHDYSIGPLFVQENYLTVRPLNAQGNPYKVLDLVAETADSLCHGDLVEKRIRGSQQWSLLPIQAMYSSVLPGELMRGPLGRPEFPQWLGNNSRRNKYDRMLQELQRHTRLTTSCNKTEFGMEYLPFLHTKLTRPLIEESNEGVPEVVLAMDAYDLIREDWDSILELGQLKGRPDVASQIPSKVKSAFTRSYNKEAHATPYATTSISKKSRRSTTDVSDDENGDYESEQESDSDVTSNPMIRTTKKKLESSKKAVSQKESSDKGKGKAGSQGSRKKGK